MTAYLFFYLEGEIILYIIHEFIPPSFSIKAKADKVSFWGIYGLITGINSRLIMNYGTRGFGASSLAELTFNDVLTQQAIHSGDDNIFTFFSEGDNKKELLTFAGLDQSARKIAAYLQAHKLKGERALLLFPPGLEYIEGFFGCLYAGVIAVPAYPPSPAAIERSLPRLETISKDADAAIILTTEKIIAQLKLFFKGPAQNTIMNKSINRWKESEAADTLSKMQSLAIDSKEISEYDGFKKELIKPDSIAFLQYTSGSTRVPRGVMVSHKNLVYNTDLIQRSLRITAEENAFVMWLPFYHDMGLIGGVLEPIYSGMQTTFISPLSFLSWPLRWLQIISSIKDKRVVSGGPNFAYELCLRKVSNEQIEELDLKNWGIAFSGAEPVRAETVETFSKTFEPAGFRHNAFYPCYGMAEQTLFVIGKDISKSPVIEKFSKKSMEGKFPQKSLNIDYDSVKLVGCGKPDSEEVIRIVNPEKRTICPNGEIGEIWISSPSVAKGYWNKPEETENTFNAYTKDSNEGPFLRTGDLGFWGEDNELFVTGRLKDLIIIRGRNFYPQDIEHTSETSHPQCRSSFVAAFSIEEEREERLVIVQEVQSPVKDPDEIITKIRQAVSAEHDVPVFSVVLIKAKTISKTSSGKIQRQIIKNQYNLKTLNVIKESIQDQDTNTSDLEIKEEVLKLTSNIKIKPNIKEIRNWLAYTISSLINVNVKTVSPEKSIPGLGMDSLMIVELKNDIESKLNINISISDLFQSPNYPILAEKIYEQLQNEKSKKSISIKPSKIVESKAPLSYGQKSLWFMQQLDPENVAYNIFFAVRIEADLDVKALKKSFDEIILRHISLRTTYHNGKNGPYQRIHTKSKSYFKIVDSSELNDADLNKTIVNEAHKPFDLSQGPLFRATLYRTGDSNHILLMNYHHIAVDLWSMVIILYELRSLYPAIKYGEVADLDSVNFQYTDYVKWQNKFLESSEGKKSYSYWEEHLSGKLPSINLPVDKTRPAVKTYNGAIFPFEINCQITSRLKSIVSEENSTLYIILLAIFNILLKRYTSQDEIIVGSPASGRSRPEFEGVVGYFVNSLIIRSNVSENCHFREYLTSLRKNVVNALDHQNYPFSLLVEKLKPYRDPSRSPIFDVMFVLERPHLLKELGLAGFILSAPQVKIDFGGLKLTPYFVDQKAAQFDLTLSIAENADSLSASLQYNADLFEAATISQMAAHFQFLLGEISKDPERRINEYSLISSDEKNVLLNQLNSAANDFNENVCVHNLFEEQACLTPEASAIVSDKEQVSYAQLNKMANRIAHCLTARGVKPGASVGIYSKRSIDMIAGIIGIMKSGGTYVPLDPEYPEERLTFMIKDAGISIILVQNEIPSISSFNGIVSIVLNEIMKQESSDWTFISTTEPGSPAYIIYTSGSTGKPKGVIVSHSALGNHCRHIRDYYELERKDRVLQFSSMSFDASLEQIFTTLITGAVLILREEELLNSSAFLKKIIENRITVINLPPSYWGGLVDEWASCTGLDLGHLRLVIIGGDAIIFKTVKKWFAFVSDSIRLINAYGPTETTITSVSCEISKAFVQNGERSLPIGRPQSNRTAYILDENGQLVPKGVVGELYIGGECLAEGYKGHPDLTAEKFIPDRFSCLGGQRLYKTGDLVRYLTDGNMEFVGRADHQVKIRGFRVELGEIESVLQTHQAVKNAVTSLQHDIPGENSIIAYVELQKKCTASELRSYLKQKMPDFLIPSIFVFLDKLPMTPAGKIDRLALPVPGKEQFSIRETFAAPRTSVEKNIAEIIAEVLGINNVSLYDNFFELGGHSLLAIKVLSRINSFYKTELSLKKLFEEPNVAGLASAIVNGQIDLDNKELDQILSDIELLSDQDVNKLLKDDLELS